MRSSEAIRAMERRTLEALMAWLQPPEEARWLLIGVPPLRPPSGASRVLQREGPLTPGQFAGSPAFDGALLLFVKEQKITAAQAAPAQAPSQQAASAQARARQAALLQTCAEQVALARAWLAPGAPLAVVLRSGGAAWEGLRRGGQGPESGYGQDEPRRDGLGEARGLPLALALALRALRWSVLTGRAGDEGNRRVSPV